MLQVVRFSGRVWSERRLLYTLVKNELKSRFLGSYLGTSWAFINPIVTILVLWFVFSFGFKSQPVSEVPFLLWLVAGMIPWFFLSDAILSSTTSVLDKAYLVKKVVFDVTLLPIVKIGAALVVHIFFVGMLLLLFVIYGLQPKIAWIGVFYYMFCSLVLVNALSWFTSSIVVFIRDIGQLTSVLLQFGYWLTPVFWAFESLPEKYRWVVKINPFHYIVNGYRESLISGVWFWEHPMASLYFWVVAIILSLSGIRLFDRLRPHFADVI